MYVANEETARNALEQAKAHYGQVGVGNVEDISILEQVGVMSSNVAPEQVFNTEEATNMLLYGKENVEYHFVETEGETFEYIANRYDLNIEIIKEANPAVDSTNMAVGEAILLTKVNPPISVQVKKLVISREETPFDTEQRDNYEMSRGESKIVEEGSAGEDEVTTEVIERNGAVVVQNRVSAVTLVEPVTRVVERGARAVVASRKLSVNLGNGILGWPVEGNITSRYGYRSIGHHSGIDIGSSIGTPVAAAADGVVVFVQYEGGYGNLIKIDHSGSLQTYYAHLQAFSVKVGDTVKRGQMIGTVGMTGRTSGPHLHLEVRYEGVHCDPIPFLEPRQVVVE
jgi:murein DD-endopeptidase MepM/ murein hydrolase activator NlpD